MKNSLLLAFCTAVFSCTNLISMSVDNKSENITEKYLLNAWSGNSRCIMPVLNKSEAPVIDGKIDENEWGKSTKLAGFHIYGKGLVPGY